MFRRRRDVAPKFEAPTEHPKVAEEQPYYLQVIEQLNALEARKRACNRQDNPNRIKSMVILDHEMNQILKEAIDNDLIPTYDNRQGWTIFGLDRKVSRQKGRR